jgi:glycosyltransferase involved in cell wall biosynthesis
MAKPKLLFYTHGLVDGGAERLWACLASAFHQRGYDVRFVEDFEAVDNRGNLDSSIPVTTLGCGHFGAVLALARLLRRERPDVALSAVGGSNLKLLLAKLLAFSPVRTIISYHGFEEWRSGWLSYLSFIGLPLLSRRADRTVAVSQGLSEALARDWRAFTPRQRAILNPVFFPKDTPVPTESELAAREDVILSAGRFVPEKDFPTLLRAFARLNHATARLVILGKGPEKAAVEGEIKKLGLEGRVILPGFIAEPWPYYAKAKCFVLSSRSEQFGNVIVEALAHGLPVVSTDAVGPEEILDGGAYGALVPAGDEAALARAMGHALVEPGDPARARARAEQFALDARVPAYEELVAEVVREAHAPPARVYLDLTHLGRQVTGIERVSIEQFEKQTFRGAEVRPVRSKSVPGMILKQQLLLPLLALLNPRALFVFPGFPPSALFALARSRAVLYIHDLFLVTRPQDLGLKAKLYMAGPFRLAVSRLKYFMTNSEKTRAELAAYIRPDSRIALYRPVVRNVFDLSAAGRGERPALPSPLRIVMVGTVEPRKNYAAAVAIRAALERLGFAGTQLHVIGREGWGGATAPLRANPDVVLHGYLSLRDAKRAIEACDLYLCTSHDEGLGLPLIEAQYAGLPVAAPDTTVFREVLGDSGLFFDPSAPEDAARIIAALIASPGWRQATADAALANAERWNALAHLDAQRITGLFERTLQESMTAAAPRTA